MIGVCTAVSLNCGVLVQFWSGSLLTVGRRNQ